MVASETFERIVKFAEADVESRLIGLLRSIPLTEIGNATKCPEKEQVLSLCNAIAGAVGQSRFLLQDFAQEFPGHLAALVDPQDLVAVRKALEVWQLARAETKDPKQPHDATVAKKSTKKLGKKGDTNSECGLLHFFHSPQRWCCDGSACFRLAGQGGGASRKGRGSPGGASTSATLGKPSGGRPPQIA